MRIDQTPGPGRLPRIAVDRPATLRDPTRLPIDVAIENLSETGALLRSAGELPVGTLISLGIAGAGLHFARVVRLQPGGMGIEFMLPIDPAAVARARSAETLVSVAFPQMTPGTETIARAAAPEIAPPAAATASVDRLDLSRLIPPVERAAPASLWHPAPLWLIVAAIAAALLALLLS